MSDMDNIRSRLHAIELTLTDLQVAIARLETQQSQSHKTLAVIGGVAATMVAGILAKPLIA